MLSLGSRRSAAAHLLSMSLYRCEILAPVTTEDRHTYALDLAARVVNALSEADIPDVDTRWDADARVASVQVCFFAETDEHAQRAVAALIRVPGVTGGIDVINLRTGRGRSHRRVAA